MSKGLWWIMFAGALAYGVFKIRECRHRMNEVQETETQMKTIETYPSLPVDSLFKKNNTTEKQ